MSIAMEKFASEGHFATYDPFRHETKRIAVFQLQCRCCGYEPDAYVSAPRVCPKCRAEAWERFARPGSILENAERY
jgi:predicted Zn-ribbon and HTH transcriptional regulator